MEATELPAVIEQLEENLDDLEAALKPLLDSSVIETANKLSVLDRSKLHVLVTYSIESLIFSFLRLNGVDARNHPVYRELTQVKQYFEKIKAAESSEEKQQPRLRVDQPAAGRILKHALASNSNDDRGSGQADKGSDAIADQPSKRRKVQSDKQ